MELHDIGWVVRKLRLGERVYRTGWNGPNQCIALKEPEKISAMTLPYVYIKTTQDEWVPWTCSQTDLLAEDWELCETE